MKNLYPCCLALLCLFTNVPAQTINDNQNIIIYGEIKSTQPIDTLHLTYWNNFLNKYASIPAPKEITIPLRSGSIFDGAIGKKVFEIAVPVCSGQGLFRLTHKKHLLLDHFISEPGDTLMFLIDLTKGKTIFAGLSGDKYRCQYELMLANDTQLFNEDPVMFTGSKDRLINDSTNRPYYKEALNRSAGPGRLMTFIESGPQVLKYLQKTFNEDPKDHPGWSVIAAYEHRLDSGYLEVLSADLFGDLMYKKLFSFNRALKNEPGYHQLYEEIIAQLPVDHFSYEAILRSSGYQEYLLMKTIIKSRMERKFIPEMLASNFKGVLKDVLIGKFLITYHSRIKNLDKHLKYAMTEVKTPWVKEAIGIVSAGQISGRPFLDVSLTDMEGDKVKISKYKGKTLLLDFWFTGCAACVRLYKTHLKKVEEHFRNDKDVLLVSICTDKDKDLWLRSVNSGKYTSREAVNLNTGGSDHELLKHYNIHSYPRQMIVDSSGRVYKASDFPEDADQLIKLLEAAANIQNSSL